MISPSPMDMNMEPAPEGKHAVQMQPMATGIGGARMRGSHGLDFLSQMDRLLVKQKIDLVEIFLGCERKNKYVIKDGAERDIFTAEEDTDFCTRQLCGNIRPFNLPIRDLDGNEVIRMVRPLACGPCCFPCCLQAMQIFGAGGELLGTVEQEWTFCYPKYLVKDAEGQPVLRIRGPCLTCRCCADVDFRVVTITDTEESEVEVGKISKAWMGLVKETFTDADTFGISFPLDLDVKMKATLLGALFLIDFMFFENNHQQ